MNRSECARRLGLPASATDEQLRIALRDEIRLWTSRLNAPKVEVRNEASARLRELGEVRQALGLEPGDSTRLPPATSSSPTRDPWRPSPTTPTPTWSAPVPSPPYGNGVPVGRPMGEPMQRPDTEEFFPHFIRYLVIGTLMGLSCYLLIGFFWLGHAARRTGFRARDIVVGFILVVPAIIWFTQIQWRYTAKHMYWTPRPEYMSKPLFYEEVGPARPTSAGPPPVGLPAVPAGWHSDPLGRHQHRFWDGQRWTDAVADSGTVGQDPIA